MHMFSFSRTQHLFSCFKIMVEFMVIATLHYALASVISVMIQWSHWGNMLLSRDGSPKGWLHLGSTAIREMGWATLDSAGRKGRHGQFRVSNNRKAARSDVNSACMFGVQLFATPLCDSCGRWPTMFLCPWDFPGKNTGAGCHFLLQGIFPTQGSSLSLLHCRQISYHLNHR